MTAASTGSELDGFGAASGRALNTAGSSAPPGSDSTAAHKRELDALDHALANDIEYPTELVGYHVPDWAREWGEQNNLTVRESEFAPRGMLYVIGAIPAVEGIEASRV